METSEPGIPPPIPPQEAAASPAPPFAASPFKDRSTGLVIFGILEILGGALCALAIPFLLLSAMLARKAVPGVPLRNLPVSVLTYVLMAGVLIALGIGAIQAKRWAWALNLILSWVSLITGILITAMIVVVLPASLRAGMQAAQNQSSPGVPTGIMAAIVTFLIVLVAVLFIAVPSAFLLFYRSKNVEETCRHRDPVERWTDRRPLPVTAMTLLVASSSVYSLLMSVSTPVLPFFGRYLSGVPGGFAYLLLAALEAYIAVSFFRMKVAGWWLALVVWVARLFSFVITYSHRNLTEFYAKLGWSQAQIEAVQRNPLFRSGGLLWMTPVIMLFYLGFLLWLKRYFGTAKPPSYSASASPHPTAIPPEV